jgi:ABC-type multidrug transport system fused ATPase/permease subunit
VAIHTFSLRSNTVVRFYEVDSGQILCNDHDISKLNIFGYRNHLSLVAQEATLFQGKGNLPPSPSNQLC